MKTTIVVDDAPMTGEEAEVTDVNNVLLLTLVSFALSIRDHRRDPDAIREKLLSFLLGIVPAEQAAILPETDADIPFEPIAAATEDAPLEPLAVKREIVDQVSKSGRTVMLRSIVCLAMEAFHSRQGIIYIQTSRVQPFERSHLELLMGVATVAAIAIEHAAQLQVLEIQNSLMQEDLALRTDMIGNSKKLRDVKELIRKAAETDSTILIQGETGTGKEVVARAIHNNSHRSGRPFVAVNCGVLAEGTVESELFGHERGAFTGAIAQKKGKFELADGGTLFLDEIGELSLPLQVKLLRVLQEREFERVGGARPIRVNIRVVAATHRDLEGAVVAGTFREDLYYRLKVLTITTPPLRDRREDIPVLAQHFVTRRAHEMGRSINGLTLAAHKILENYDWPGNIRELQNVIERAIVLSREPVIGPQHLPDLRPMLNRHSTTLRRIAPSKPSLSMRERLEAALQESAGDCKQTALLMEWSVPTVYRKVKKYQLSYLLKRPRD
jgi:transcriptional regulator with GAF, ATPase, and Fis domain